MTRAAPATLAATYETAGTLAVLPLDTWDLIHATFDPESKDLSSRVARAAISGTWKAIAGTASAN